MEGETKNSSPPQRESWENAPYREQMVWEGETLITIRRQEDFDMVRALKEKEGPFLEVAGPTEGGFPFHSFQGNEEPERIDLFQLVADKNIFVSNLYKGLPTLYGDAFTGFEGVVDLRADARELPVEEGRLDAVFCSCPGSISPLGVKKMVEGGAGKDIPYCERIRVGEESYMTKAEISRAENELRKGVIAEATRVLKPGGLLIWRGARRQDFGFAIDAGFVVAHYEREEIRGQSRYHGIFVKKQREE
mgnify:CR=1 FL=1